MLETGRTGRTVPKKKANGLPPVEPVATKSTLCQASSCRHYRVIDGIRQLRASCITNAALLFFLICKPVFLKLLLETSALFRLFHGALQNAVEAVLRETGVCVCAGKRERDA